MIRIMLVSWVTRKAESLLDENPFFLMEIEFI